MGPSMKDEIRVFALENAIEHDGKAQMGSIMGKMMASHPELRKDPKSLSTEVREILVEVNKLSVEEQKKMLEDLGGPIELEKRKRQDPVSPLKNAEKGKVRMRFAPGPSGPLHIGHTRAAVLNDEYCRRYEGTFILRLEDTNPEKIDPDAYTSIKEDLEWLGIEVHETYVQSDRFDIYLDIAEELIRRECGYVCTMDVEEWRDLKNRSLSCPERDQEPAIQLERWEKMINGSYDEGEAFFVVKTDLEHRNPAVRDFVGIRIKKKPHPRTGAKFHLYPLYNFSVAVDDHLMSCTHILRGNDHLNNTIRQEYVYRHMGWELPEFIHYGLVSIPDVDLKTSLIKEDIIKGKYNGWDDVRLGTVRALAARGYDPGSIRRYWLEVGTKPVDIAFSWETFATMNREIIDPISDRFFFVKDPIEVHISTDRALMGSSPLQPQDKGKGFRHYDLRPENGSVKVFIDTDDLGSIKKGSLIRLKDLANIRIEELDPVSAEFIGNDTEKIKNEGGSIIHWVPFDGMECEVRYPDGNITRGLVERNAIPAARNERTVQFERVGFFRLKLEDIVIGRFSHK